MSALLSSSYRVEHKWPCTSWAYVPEHSDLTLKQARAQVAKDKSYEREGMRQRIIYTSERVVLLSKSRWASPKEREAIQRIRSLR